ncbi:MAG: DUF488 domain-containing protein [Leptolyngbyaceae bacterium]|nr:DUF488 domain-containing protein [Leptolyngbyaceae bacterium]
MQTIFTIGHSNHSLDAFLSLLQQHEINALADVRSAPYSRYLPHFNQKALQAYLPKAAIRYVFLGQELGARPRDSSCYVAGKAVYEKIAATTFFQHGLQRLIQGSQTYRIALMCAEKDPLTCHRAILIGQHLVPWNVAIAHIHSDGNLESHDDLETRLLSTHHLEDPPQNQQLSLLPGLDPTISLDRNDRIHQAYQYQGAKVAYVEEEQHGQSNYD